MRTMQYTRAALKGMKRFTEDRQLLLKIDSVLLLSPDASPSFVLAGSILDSATEAYSRWSTSMRLMRS